MLKELITGGASKILEVASGIIDQFVESDEDKLTAKLQLGAMLQARDALLEESYRAEIAAQRDILVAELGQDDKFTKRARPMIIYTGLALFALNFLLPAFGLTPGEIPVEFTGAWGGVCGLYVWGRSREKRGDSQGRMERLFTGTGGK